MQAVEEGWRRMEGRRERKNERERKREIEWCAAIQREREGGRSGE